MNTAVNMTQEEQEELLLRLKQAEAKAAAAEQRAERAETALALSRMENIQIQNAAVKVANGWARIASTFCSWWHTLMQHYKKLKKHKEWEEELFSNQELTPRDKLYEWGIAPAIEKSTHPEGYAPVTEAWIRKRTGIPESTQQATRKRLVEAGILRAETVFDPVKAKSHLFVAFNEEALSAPSTQTQAPDAPKNGGYRRVCEGCGGHSFKQESQIRKRFTCLSCGDMNIIEMPWRPMMEVTAVYDGPETRTEREMKEPRNQPCGSQTEPHIRTHTSNDDFFSESDRYRDTYTEDGSA